MSRSVTVADVATAAGVSRQTVSNVLDAADEIRQFARLSDGADVDGFVLTSTFHQDPRTSWLLANDIPFVTFGRPWDLVDKAAAPHPWVDVDGRAGLREATRHLLDRGYRQIGFLGWPSPSGQGDERRRGWRDGMGDTPGLDRLDLAGPDDVNAASAVVTAARERGVVFDALVCASDTLALGARFVLDPDVPVVGYDDTPVAAALGLSSVEQPLAEAASAAFELLMGPTGRIVAPAATGHRLLRPTVVWRGPR